jgi:recombination associated protein RdgC
VVFLDILKEETQDQAEDAEEQFDIDFALMTGELAALLDDLVKALGGEKKSA